jgi:membrane protein required for colicin V production
MVNKAITGTVAGRADRILGGIFGIIKAILICFVLLTILHILPFGGVVEETRNDAVAYAAYKGTLETMGYSSDPIDLVGVAERKATEFTKNMANKAAEKTNEAVKEATEKATEAAKEAAKEATDKAVDAAKEAAKEAAQKAANEITDKATETIKQ